MSLKLQLIIIIISILYLMFIFANIRKGVLKLKYSLLWLFTGIVFLILSVFPSLLEMISSALGIYAPTNTLFLIITFSIIMIIFTMTISLSKSTDKIISLTQELGLLKKELEDFKNSK